jgi:hypothetical protein
MRELIKIALGDATTVSGRTPEQAEANLAALKSQSVATTLENKLLILRERENFQNSMRKRTSAGCKSAIPSILLGRWVHGDQWKRQYTDHVHLMQGNSRSMTAGQGNQIFVSGTNGVNVSGNGNPWNLPAKCSPNLRGDGGSGFGDTEHLRLDAGLHLMAAFAKRLFIGAQNQTLSFRDLRVRGSHT